ncbi:hypothetical protein CRENBAI_001563 [Crenichthys baileyi]|uniref:Uncharacterized protein n=1 Tax=Crenichthys baileyi TaxID=28760 RepID=A0AAV9RNX7_9TELE
MNQALVLDGSPSPSKAAAAAAQAKLGTTTVALAESSPPPPAAAEFPAGFSSCPGRRLCRRSVAIGEVRSGASYLSMEGPSAMASSRLFSPESEGGCPAPSGGCRSSERPPTPAWVLAGLQFVHAECMKERCMECVPHLLAHPQDLLEVHAILQAEFLKEGWLDAPEPISAGGPFTPLLEAVSAAAGPPEPQPAAAGPPEPQPAAAGPPEPSDPRLISGGPVGGLPPLPRLTSEGPVGGLPPLPRLISEGPVGGPPPLPRHVPEEPVGRPPPLPRLTSEGPVGGPPPLPRLTSEGPMGGPPPLPRLISGGPWAGCLHFLA